MKTYQTVDAEAGLSFCSGQIPYSWFCHDYGARNPM